jgi:hypothetical protein
LALPVLAIVKVVIDFLREDDADAIDAQDAVAA